MSDMMKELQKPFKADEIEWRIGSTNSDKTKGLALAYVTNRAIQNRLDEVFGPLGWQNEFKEWKGNSQICGISVWDENKKQWITKWDGADDSATEAVKGGLSDSMKRAAYQWGIGRYLYNLPQTWMPLKNSKYLDGTPALPKWALPEGEPPKATIDAFTAKQLEDLMKRKGDAAVKLLSKYKVNKLTELTAEQYTAAKTYYEGLPDKAS